MAKRRRSPNTHEERGLLNGCEYHISVTKDAGSRYQYVVEVWTPHIRLDDDTMQEPKALIADGYKSSFLRAVKHARSLLDEHLVHCAQLSNPRWR